jgi:DNA polymerase-3 subunit gamma/tau
MAYLSLYRKHRPQTFAEILGQDHVSTTLANAIVEDRVAHAYLFTGPRGTGKTSTARILAKALNCEKGPTPEPCGVCYSCTSITDGSSLDVIEMDAASHSKVEETRGILDGVPLASAGGKKKVYVIDEVHMLTTQSFNALLKTLEEPPQHVIFILATTEAHKVLPTIVSRTQRFDFRRISVEVLEKHLLDIAARENIDLSPGAAGVIARHAEGGARDALSALDQLSSITGGKITEDEADGLLGGRHEDSYMQLFDAIAAGEVGGVFLTMNSLAGEGADPRQLAIGIIEHARSLLLLKTAPDAGGLLDAAPEDIPILASQAERYSPEGLVRLLELISVAHAEMRTAANHRLLLEVALVRAADPHTDPSASGLMGRIERLERRFGISDQGGEAPPAAAQPVQGAAPARRAPTRPTPQAPIQEAAPEPTVAPKPARKQPPARPAAEAPRTAPSEQPQAPAPETAQPAAPSSAAGIGLGHIRDAWSATIAEVGKASPRVKAYLNPSRPLAFEGGELFVEVQAKFHVDAMSEAKNRDALGAAVFAALGIKPSLKFVERGGAPEAVVEESANTEAQAPPTASVADPVETPAEGEMVDIEDTTPVEGSEHDPVELVKRGLGAEVVEERTAG